MTKLELLNAFLNDRLTAAAEEIFRAVKDTVAEYQSEILRSKEENERLRRLLDVAVQRLLLQPGEVSGYMEMRSLFGMRPTPARLARWVSVTLLQSEIRKNKCNVQHDWESLSVR